MDILPMEILVNIFYIILVFIALGFCIFSHELGHFLAARLMGLHIDAFSLGFRPIWRKKYKGVEYRIGWLLLGGYVELPQVDASDDVPKSADGMELPRATPKARIVTAFAGPLFNILSGLLLGCIVWAVGIPEGTPRMREIEVLSVPENSPEYAAGLRKGDIIVKLNGGEFHDTWEKFVEKILFTIDEVKLEVRRGDEILTISYLPAENPDAPGKAGQEKLAYPFFKPLLPIKLYPLPGGAAEAAGIKDGDIVTAIDGKEIIGLNDFQTALAFSDGRKLEFSILRDGETVRLAVAPTPVPGRENDERYLIGLTMETVDDKVKAASLMSGGSAAEAGVMAGDILLAVDGIAIDRPEVLSGHVGEKKTQMVKLTVQRDGKEMEFTMIPRRFAAYELGVQLAATNHPNPLELLGSTLAMTWKSIRGIGTTIGNKLNLTDSQSSLKPSHMSSTLGIGMALYDSFKTSPMYGLYLVVVISFALAIFNLLPLPVLDGGHILFGVLEWVTGKRIPGGVMKVISCIFITLLILLTVCITFFDGKRLIRKFSDEPGKVEQKDAPDNP